MLTIFGRADSNNVQAVMWLVGELGITHERRDIGQRFGGNRTPEFLAMNPMGLVPVIKDGEDAPIAETGAILRYLASRFGFDETFWPSAPAARAQVDRWAEWAKVEVAAAFQAPIFYPMVMVKPENRDPAAVEKALPRLNARLDIAEALLSAHSHLAGEAFTLADIVFGSLLYRYFTVEIARADRPALQRYYETLCARPAYREHVMVSYEALRGIA
ncbi:MAG: glutathione S-transferase family protein [Pseudomonadota bacterium]|nr:glutathione S-transferase family protein [Pseudomonadota bacterium]